MSDPTPLPEVAQLVPDYLRAEFLSITNQVELLHDVLAGLVARAQEANERLAFLERDLGTPLVPMLTDHGDRDAILNEFASLLSVLSGSYAMGSAFFELIATAKRHEHPTPEALEAERGWPHFEATS